MEPNGNPETFGYSGSVYQYSETVPISSLVYFAYKAMPEDLQLMVTKLENINIAPSQDQDLVQAGKVTHTCSPTVILEVNKTMLLSS